LQQHLRHSLAKLIVSMGTQQTLISSVEDLPSVGENPATTTQKCEVHITYKTST